MSEIIFDLEASPELMPEIVRLAHQYGIKPSEPMATDSVSDALDAPLGVDEIRQILEVVTLVATTGTTVVGFFAAVKALLGRSEAPKGREPEVHLVEFESRRKIGTLNGATDVASLRVVE